MTATDKGVPEFRCCSDEQLIAYARRVDASNEAFAELIGRHRNDLLWRCRMRLGNLPDAEDAVQETFIRAHRALASFKGASSFRTWLFAIAENQCNSVHARRMRHILSDHLKALIVLQEECESKVPKDDVEDLRETVRRILNTLPCQARDVLSLRFDRDLSLEEIAKTLGIGLSASKMRLYRAISLFEHEFATAKTTGT